jgi:predicted transposase/invertase (TIGR01784 family)
MTMMPGVDPKVDYAFKKVFGSESNVAVLLNLLNAVLKPTPDRQIVALQILNPFNDKEVTDDKLSILDIKARDQEGRRYNVEMQMAASGMYPQRVLYYWASLYSRQLMEGDDYVDLQPTYSISFVNSMIFPGVLEYHLEFQLRSLQHQQLAFSQHQSMHVLELPKFRRLAEELSDARDVWCYFLVNGINLDTEQLPTALQVPAVRQAMEALKMLTQDDLERERYESRLKAQRDRTSELRYARMEGQAEARLQGLEQGREQGLEQGEVIGQIHFCQRMMKLPLTPRDELLAMPLEKLRDTAKSLEEQLRVPGV